MIDDKMKLQVLFWLSVWTLVYVQETVARGPLHNKYCIIGAGPGGERDIMIVQCSAFVFVAFL